MGAEVARFNIVLKMGQEGTDEVTRKLLEAAAAQKSVEGGQAVVTTSSRKMSSALTSVAFSAAGIPGPIGRIASALGGFINPATAAVAVMGLLISHFISAREEAKKYAAQLESIAELQYKLGRISAKEYLAKLKQEADSARLDAKLIKEKRGVSLRSRGLWSFFAPSAEDVADKEQIALTKEFAYAEAAKGHKEVVLKLDKDALAVENARVDAMMKEVNLLYQQTTLQSNLSLSIENAAAQERERVNNILHPVLSPVKVPGGLASLSSRSRQREVQSEFIVPWQKENAVLQVGILSLGDTLRDSLGGAFNDVFGEANSLLEQFAQRLVEILGSQFIFGLLKFAFPGAGIASIFNFGGGDSGGTDLRIEKALGNPRVRNAQARVTRQNARLGLAA